MRKERKKRLTTGAWHEVRAEECLPGVVETADKYRKKKGGTTQ